MKKHKSNRSFLLALVCVFTLVAVPTQMMAAMNTPEAQLRVAERNLWDAHVTWTRLYIISALADLPDINQVVERLMQNQVDLGNAIKPYYGEEAGEKLTALLKSHIAIAADIVAAAKAGDNAKVGTGEKRWTANADSMAAFLSGANPNWTMAALQEMLHKHLALTTQEVVDRLKRDYKADIADYDRIHDEAMMMADALAEGIIKQFPKKFEY